jgi:hypothetical protein
MGNCYFSLTFLYYREVLELYVYYRIFLIYLFFSKLYKNLRSRKLKKSMILSRLRENTETRYECIEYEVKLRILDLFLRLFYVKILSVICFGSRLNRFSHQRLQYMIFGNREKLSSVTVMIIFVLPINDHVKMDNVFSIDLSFRN